ncbi:allene oxide cyclase barrel-like domain-containing protein [Streptomyces capparidis]
MTVTSTKFSWPGPKAVWAATAATAALVAAAGWTQSSASSASDPAGRGARVTYTSRLVSTDRPSELRTGDTWVSYSHLFDAKGRKVGDASGQCAAVHVAGNTSTISCLRILRTAKGSVSMHQLADYRDGRRIVSDAPLTGGTGVYRDVKGGAVVDTVGGSGVVKQTFRTP